MTLQINTEAFAEKTDLAAIEELAKFVVLEEAKNEALAAEMKARAEKIETAKSDISRMLAEAGIESAKLSCGLTPRRKVNKAFYAVGGINTEPVFNWLKENNLEDVIDTSPRVHFQTLQSALAEFEGLGGCIPEDLFKVSETETITMYGKSKFLAREVGGNGNQ
jgi:hypothetical protein